MPNWLWGVTSFSYTLGFAIYIAIVHTAYDYRYERRYARFLLLTPVWPAVAVGYGLPTVLKLAYIALRKLWATAGLWPQKPLEQRDGVPRDKPTIPPTLCDNCRAEIQDGPYR